MYLCNIFILYNLSMYYRDYRMLCNHCNVWLFELFLINLLEMPDEI